MLWSEQCLFSYDLLLDQNEHTLPIIKDPGFGIRRGNFVALALNLYFSRTEKTARLARARKENNSSRALLSRVPTRPPFPSPRPARGGARGRESLSKLNPNTRNTASPLFKERLGVLTKWVAEKPWSRRFCAYKA